MSLFSLFYQQMRQIRSSSCANLESSTFLRIGVHFKKEGFFSTSYLDYSLHIYMSELTSTYDSISTFTPASGHLFQKSATNFDEMEV